MPLQTVQVKSAEELSAFLREYQQGGITDFTLNGECTSCGACCSNNLPMTEKEVRAIRRYVRRNHIQEQKHLPAILAGPVLDLTCPFRDNHTRTCVIYPVRPAICRDFRCDRPKLEMRAAVAGYRDRLRDINVRETFFGGAQHD